MVALADALRGRRVLVTGDTGFKGSWLSLWLHEMGAEVFGYAHPETTDTDLFARLGLRGLIDHTDGDICDAAALDAAFARAKPEVVLHLAAQSLVRESYLDPVETYRTNLMGSVHVLEAVRNHRESVRALVYVTSDKCYHNNEWVYGYRETDRLGGKDPYSASKAAAEVVFASYSHSYLETIATLGYGSARAGNVIGGGDWARDRIVPDTITALGRGEPVALRNPAATRPWQHVLDPLSGYLALAASYLDTPLQHRGAWNFGPSSASNRPVGALVDEIIRNWGTGSAEHHPAPDGHMPEAGLLHLNCDKARLRLGWAPRWGFERAVAETVDWYARVARGEDALAVTRAQIARYTEGEADAGTD